jgi:hypothetical protein
MLSGKKRELKNSQHRRYLDQRNTVFASTSTNSNGATHGSDEVAKNMKVIMTIRKKETINDLGEELADVVVFVVLYTKPNMMICKRLSLKRWIQINTEIRSHTKQRQIKIV